MSITDTWLSLKLGELDVQIEELQAIRAELQRKYDERAGDRGINLDRPASALGRFSDNPRTEGGRREVKEGETFEVHPIRPVVGTEEEEAFEESGEWRGNYKRGWTWGKAVLFALLNEDGVQKLTLFQALHNTMPPAVMLRDTETNRRSMGGAISREVRHGNIAWEGPFLTLTQQGREIARNLQLYNPLVDPTVETGAPNEVE